MTPLRLTAAYVFDLLAGDPEWFPHPVRFFGALIRAGERWLRRFSRDPVTETLAGAALTASVVSIAWFSGAWASRRPNRTAWQVLLAWTALATRSLLSEAAAVIRALEAGDLPQARSRLARIVGRDTAHLDSSEIARAVIETLAESACDGIVAPLFWMAVGGLPAAMAYKAVNTLDSMIGHPEPPYRYFGKVAARLDDVANFVPARLTALAIVGASDHPRAAWNIWWRDGNQSASPNAGQSESAIAGALAVRLGGTNVYDGHPREAALMCAEGRPPTARDARKALGIVAAVSAIAFGAALLCLSRKRSQ
jgi:adenosylcobinamide-phosphate synthase